MNTFRKWNPEKVHVPYGESTDAEGDSTWGPLLCCYPCVLVNLLFGVMFEEAIDHVTDSKQSPENFFHSQTESVKTANSVFRPLGIFLNILGIYFLF